MGCAWVKFLNKVYKEGKATDPNYKYKLAMKDAAVRFKKGEGRESLVSCVKDCLTESRKPVPVPAEGNAAQTRRTKKHRSQSASTQKHGVRRGATKSKSASRTRTKSRSRSASR